MSANLLLCNSCENRGCPFSEKQLNSMDTNKCKHYVSPEPFKVPMLIHLIHDQPDVVNKMLGLFGLKIKETGEKPYFMLTVNA